MSDTEPGLPGARLGLPTDGAGSVSGFGRRLVALAIDWALSVLVVAGFGFDPLYGPASHSALALLVLALEQTVLVGLLGTTVGHRLVGIAAVRLDGQPVGLARGLVRAVLVCLLVPPLVLDRDARGLHDLAAGTVVVRR